MIEQYLAALALDDIPARCDAARMLGEIRDPAAVEALVACLQHSDAKSQYSAFSALVKIGAAAAAPPMVDTLLGTSSSRLWELMKLNIGMRLRAGLLNIVQRGDSGTADKLTNALKQDHYDEYQRAYLMQLLGRTGDERAVESLINTLIEDTELLRVSAADALGWIGDERAVQPLLSALEQSPADSSVREVAAEALGRIGNPEVIPALVASLTDTNEWVRRASAVALGDLGDQSVMDALAQALGDESALVQDAAFEAIKKLSDTSFTTEISP